MLTRRLVALGRWARPRMAAAPWASGVGLARTLLALGTLGTLLATSPQALMAPLADGTRPPVCVGPTQIGIWCVVPGWDGQAARWLSVAVLLVTASGWRPRLTGIPHWYVSWSLMVNATVVDGGDQVTAVLTLLLIPLTLTDPRRWHWQRAPERDLGLARVVAYGSVVLIQIQVAILYLHASVAKLGVREWADGTALFYWLRNPMFGAPGWLRPVIDPLTGSPFGVALLTWSAIALEFALALAIVLHPRVRPPLLVAGLAFHWAIAIVMGLISFSTAMSAALLLYLLPVGRQLSVPEPVRRLVDQVPTRPARRRYPEALAASSASAAAVRE